MKPTISPELMRTVLTILGWTLSALAVSQQLTWQTVLAALGGAIATWLRIPRDAVRISDLPKEIQDSVRPPPPPSPESTSADLGDQ